MGFSSWTVNNWQDYGYGALAFSFKKKTGAKGHRYNEGREALADDCESARADSRLRVGARAGTQGKRIRDRPGRLSSALRRRCGENGRHRTQRVRWCQAQRLHSRTNRQRRRDFRLRWRRARGHFHNEGNGRFREVSEQAGVALKGWGQGVCVGDYDNDGHPDMLVAFYGHNVLLRNRGD